MIRIWNRALIPAAVALGLTATAQSVDLAPAPARSGPPTVGHLIAPPGGSAKATLWDNGTYITGIGNGFGGADTSQIESGLSLFGWGHQFTLGNRIADDFVVPSGDTWTLSNLRWLAYQTGAATTGTITGIYTDYVAGASPNGAVIAGDTTTNRLQSSTWTGVYRVTSTTLTNNQRALIEVTADAAFVPPLAAGQYWVRVMCDGTLTSGPWCPPTVPWDAADNNQQEIGVGTGFVPTTAGQGFTPGDSVFWVDGSTSGGATTYCTTKTTSCGSMPSINGPAATASISAGAGSYDVTYGPTNGANVGAFGILVYTTNGPLAAPFLGVFGWHCIDEGPGFFRVPSAQLAVGSGCNAFYSFDIGLFLATQTSDPNLVAGASVDMQGWYRDPPALDTANLTNALQFTLVP